MSITISQSPPQSDTNSIAVFAIGGQSNAVGQGTSGPTVSAGNVLQYYGGTVKSGNDPVGPANTGSAWPAFGNKYYEMTGQKICFVPSAVDGSSQSAAMDNGNGNWDASGTLTAALITNVTNALAALKAAGYQPVFKGILWCQGETDASLGAVSYQTALVNMIGRFRNAFGLSMPFYIFRTGDTPDAIVPPSWQVVRRTQDAVANALPKVYMAYRDTFYFAPQGLMKDLLHYKQSAYNLMGSKGAEKIVSITNYDKMEIKE